MVFLTLSKKIANTIGPALFRSGLLARNALVQKANSPYLDMMFLLPFSQKLISLAIYDDSRRVVSQFYKNDKMDATFAISDLRLQVLSDNMRPALLPNEVWDDVDQWRWNLRVVKWARSEFLVSKYGPQVKEALDAYPQIRASPQLTPHPTHKLLLNLARGTIDLGQQGEETTISNKHNNAIPLPSTETLAKAFGLKRWARKKNSRRLKDSVYYLASQIAEKEDQSNKKDKGLPFVDISADKDVRKVSMEDILEIVCGGHVKSCGPFNTICEEAGMYQFWTKEYIQYLGDYLLKQTMARKGGETTILDIGAGDGLLIHYLQQYISNKSRRNNLIMPTMVSTDDGSWGIFAKAQVEKLNVDESLQKYAHTSENHSNDNQLIVLCSWMPQSVDWSERFRQYGVDEYILIGESDDGSCGDNWKTWGNIDFLPSNDVVHPSKQPLPAYQEDGYTRWDMTDLTPFQFSRFDCSFSRSGKTVSFRKMKQRKE